MHELLANQGRLIVLTPARPWLYCGLDKELAHFRRYDRHSLRQVVESAGFHILDIVDHNFLGAVGWFWAGKVRGRRQLNDRDVRRMNRLVPLLKYLDPPLRAIFGGVSLIAVAVKEGASPP
jgi:hypothetical protein